MLMIGAALLLGTQALYAQTCNGSITATAPDSRYTDHGNGTVTDNQTGLMWKQCSEGLTTTSTPCDTDSVASYSWQDALTQAQTVNSSGFAGYNDWRLPNRNELASLVERRCYRPAINATLFPATRGSYYWSSSPYADNSGNAWGVHFYHGYVNSSGKGDAFYVRLVRGGQ